MWSPSNRQTRSVTLRGLVELLGAYGMNTVGILSGHVQRCSLLVATCLILSTTVAKAEPITEQQAHAIGVDAYLYFYSLVTMDLTRRHAGTFAKVFIGPPKPLPVSTFVSCSTQLRYPLFVGVASSSRR